MNSVLPGRTFSRDGGSAPDAPEAGALCRSSDPLSGRSDSRVIVLCFRGSRDIATHDLRRASPCAAGESVRTRPSSLLFPYGRPLSRKENPPWDPHRRLLARLRCRSARPVLQRGHCHNPCPGPGILTWFPFAGRCDALREEGDDVRFLRARHPIARPCTGLTPSLRTG